jgi:hypothetical protein
MPSALSETARRLANGPWCRRYARHLAAECDEALVVVAAALEASLLALLPRVDTPAARLLPRLTGAWMTLLYKGAEPSSNPTEQRIRESRAIRAFARRVCDRPEPRFLDALSSEFLEFFDA